MVSDGFPLIQAVVPKNQTRSFIIQGSDILVRVGWKISQKPKQLIVVINVVLICDLCTFSHAGDGEFEWADRNTQLAAV